MSNFIGFCNLNKDISLKNINTLNILSDYYHSKENLFISKHTNLGYKNDVSPISFKYNDNTYTIVYTGNLYNSKDIKENLITLGYEFNRFF